MCDAISQTCVLSGSVVPTPGELKAVAKAQLFKFDGVGWEFRGGKQLEGVL
jgi:hypothetical protein